MKRFYDIDGVVAWFSKAIIERAQEMGYGADEFPQHPDDVTSWEMGPAFPLVWKSIKHSEEFWLDRIPAMPYTLPISDNVDGYITSRPVSETISQRWLLRKGYPYAPVYNVPKPEMKTKLALELGVTHFIDDKIETVNQMRQAGIRAVLMIQPYARKRLHEVEESVQYLAEFEKIK